MRRIILILLMVFLSISLGLGVYNKSIKSAYGLSGWSGYYFVKIDNNKVDSTALTDYQIKVEMDPTLTDFWNNVQPDARVVRFTEDDGETLLPYWIEKWDYENRKATIWVKVPDIPVGIKYIYMYYGNPSISGIGWHTDPDNPTSGWWAGDGDSTFIFFDDFEGGSVNTGKWDKGIGFIGGIGRIDVSNGRISLSSSSYLNDRGYAYIKSKRNFDEYNEFIWEIEAKVHPFPKYSWEHTSYPNGINRIRHKIENIGVGDYFIMEKDKTENPISHIKYQYPNGPFYSDSIDKWLKMTQTLFSNGTKFEIKVVREEDGQTEVDTSTSTSLGSNRKLVIVVGENGGGLAFYYKGKTEVDYTFVRKYADVEPEISVEMIPLIKGTATRTGYFEFFVDREGRRWLLRIPDRGYTTGWIPFDRLRDTGNFMSGYYADRRYHLTFDWYSSGRCSLLFNDRREGVNIKYGGR
ncbi:MAG: hypothetical protein DRI28_06870 [Caldiserica bacterium]|nr:MAG: hypothetical protein DRI28_06870 [Caldisericota bacterium]